MSVQSSELLEHTPHQSSDRPDACAPIAASSWNHADMRALSLTRDARLPTEFGTFELFTQAPSTESAMSLIAAQKPNAQPRSFTDPGLVSNLWSLSDIPNDDPHYRHLAKEYFVTQAKECKLIPQREKEEEAPKERNGSPQYLSENDGIAQATKAPPAKIEIREDIKPGVSRGFKDDAENWMHNKVPRHLQQLMHDNGIGLTVYANSSQVPEKIREEHARNHKDRNEKVGNLNMFYDPISHSMVFIEHPDKTPTQNRTQEFFTHGGIQTYQHGPDEKNAWHELGHALDYKALRSFSHSKQFDAAFENGNASITQGDKDNHYYFCNPTMNAVKGHEYDAAKEEVFAQIFAAVHTPESQRTETDNFLLAHFKGVAELMRGVKFQLFSL